MNKNLLLLIIVLSNVSTHAQFTLDSCKVLALKNNAKIKNIDIDLMQAEKTKMYAKTQFFPKINASGFAFKSANPLLDINSKNIDLSLSFANQTFNDIFKTLSSNYAQYIDANINAKTLQDGYSGYISAILPIYAGGRIRNSNKLADLGVEAAKLNTNINTNEVEIETEESYWRIVSLKEKMKTIKSAQKLLDTLKKDVDGAYKQGIIIENDLLKVKLKQNELTSNKIKVENGIKLSEFALCQLINIDFVENIQLIDSISLSDSVLPPWQYHVRNEDVLKKRNEYKLLDISVEAAKKREVLLLGESLPSVTIGSAYSYYDIAKNTNSNAIVFATISIPISALWENDYKIQKEKLEIAKKQNEQKDLNGKLILQIQQGWNNVEVAYYQVVLAKETVFEAKQNLKVATDYYHSGMTTVAEVLEAQTLLSQCIDNFIDQNVNYKIKLSQYRLMIK